MHKGKKNVHYFDISRVFYGQKDTFMPLLAVFPKFGYSYLMLFAGCMCEMR